MKAKLLKAIFKDENVSFWRNVSGNVTVETKYNGVVFQFVVECVEIPADTLEDGFSRTAYEIYEIGDFSMASIDGDLIVFEPKTDYAEHIRIELESLINYHGL